MEQIGRRRSGLWGSGRGALILAVPTALLSAFLSMVLAHWRFDGGHPESMIGIYYIAVLYFGVIPLIILWATVFSYLGRHGVRPSRRFLVVVPGVFAVASLPILVLSV